MLTLAVPWPFNGQWKWWENPGKTLRFAIIFLGKTQGTWWEHDGKTRENDGNMMGKLGKMIGKPPFGKEKKPWGSVIDSDRTIFFWYTWNHHKSSIGRTVGLFLGGEKSTAPTPLPRWHQRCTWRWSATTTGAWGSGPATRRSRRGRPGRWPGLLRPAYGMDHHHFEGHGNHGTHGMGSGWGLKQLCSYFLICSKDDQWWSMMITMLKAMGWLGIRG